MEVPPVEGESAVSVSASLPAADPPGSTSAAPSVAVSPKTLTKLAVLDTSLTISESTQVTIPVQASIEGTGVATAALLSQADVESSLIDQDGLAKDGRAPRRKPGARECMQLSRRFGSQVIPEPSMEILMDYCKRGKCEHLIRMRERLDEHCRFLESQLAGLEILAQEQGTESHNED
jgi:hypothetical protein